MKGSNLFFGLLCSVIMLQSCSPVFQKEITSMDKQSWQPLELTPGYDFYFMRLDIIRDRESRSTGNGTSTTIDAPYHRLGFHLGNGLFYDLNDNLCLLVPKIYGLGDNEEFSIEEQTSTNRSNYYTRERDKFTTRSRGIFSQTDVVRISEDEEDGALVLKSSILNKVKIYESENELAIKYPLGKTIIKKDGKGYSTKQLFGRRNYMKFNGEIILDNRYVIKERGNRIEIFSKRGRLIYSIVRSEDKVIIYNRKNRGYKLEFKDTEMEYRRNKTLQAVYKLG